MSAEVSEGTLFLKPLPATQTPSHMPRGPHALVYSGSIGGWRRAGRPLGQKTHPDHLVVERSDMVESKKD